MTYRHLCIYCLLLIPACGAFAQAPTSLAQSPSPGPRPKIGLVLSGGGAKGLAHIGILKAIDSAGLKIDYITRHQYGGNHRLPSMPSAIPPLP